MPHDVIMPALGMAQDEGLIVAWLKRPGDPVKAGDALMEVETDKATMEVEAAVDGFLSDVRAGEGESVPVGRIVAVIAETAEAIRLSGAEAADAGGAAPEAGAPSPQAGAAAPGEALPEGHSVVMPALGMAQDSGVVVGWLKAPGEAVAEGEPLLEVETDKATMEVPAERGGYLAAILAEEGDDVPVGETIAILSASEPASTIRRARAAGGAETGAAAPAAPPARAEAKPEGSAPTPEAAPPGRAQERPRAAGGRILASPKARRLAAEEGLDLADLVAAGHPQPYRVADLEVLRALPRAVPAAQAEAARPAAAPPCVLTAELPAAPLDAFRAWLAEEAAGTGAPEPSGPRLLAAFAAGALRAAQGAVGAEGPLAVAAGGPGAPVALADPDRAPLLAALPDAGADAPPALILRDLTGTALTGFAPGVAVPPVLTLTRRGDTLALHFAHDEAALSQDAAIAFVSGLADRLAEPLRQLL